jgi:hypothetical protein
MSSVPDGDRPASYVVRWTRWLYRHTVVHFGGLVLVSVAVATGMGTVFTLPRVLIGAIAGVAWALWIRRILMPKAILTKRE